MRKLAVVLFNLGGPDGPDAVQPFLQNLFCDPAIISLPWIVRAPLGRFIARKRAPIAREIYQKIGGGSPIVAETQKQARALEALLAQDGVEAPVGLVVVVVVLVEDGQVHQRVEVDRGRRADPLVKLDRLGVFRPAVVEHRQVERRLLVVGVLAQRPLVELDRPLVVPLFVRLQAAAVVFLCGPLVDRRNRGFAHISASSVKPKSVRTFERAATRRGT